MTEKEFIEQYVAQNTSSIRIGVDEHGLSRESMVQALVNTAKETWTMLQKEIGEEQTDAESQEELQFKELKPNTIYVGEPEDMGSQLKKMIFCLVRKPDCLLLTLRCALYIEATGDYKLHVLDKAAHHAVSYESNKCVVIGKDLVGFDCDHEPLVFRTPSQSEVDLLHEMLVSARINIYDAYDGMRRFGLDNHLMNED